MADQSPRVYFVGAGPGDPELLTVKASRLISQADVILYAGSLVPRSLLNPAKPGARIEDSSGLTLDQSHALIREAALAGRLVVRLHTGDPSLFGAVREQARLLEAEGIAYAIVPGVTAAMAAAAAARISFTVPEACQTLILTRLGGHTPMPQRQDLRSLAGHQAALAVYLSGASPSDLAHELLAGGYPPDTLIIAAHRVGWPEEDIQRMRLDKLVDSGADKAWKRQTVFLVLPGQDLETVSRLYDARFSHAFRSSGQ
jgi:precorrin-4/cobalt-precorrin-4 C11-methyltransferase